MKSPWRIEMIRLQNGENYPLLINRKDGLPLFNPTVYATSMVRNKGLAESTTKSNLRAIMFSFGWGARHGINIEERFHNGEFLKLHEIESLCKEVRLRYDKLYEDIPDSIFSEKQSKKPRRKKRAIAMKRHRNTQGIYCGEHLAFVRLCYIRNYLDWLASQRMARLSANSKEYHRLQEARKVMWKEINKRLPEVERGRVKDPHFERLGLTEDQERILLEVVKPDSPRNPFKQKHVKVRNQLIIHMMLETGIRRGELLGIRTTDGDLDFQKCTVTIHRIPIDPLDTRRHKPQTKTRARILAMSKNLTALVREYMLKYRGNRKKLPFAGMNPFLIVESRKGRPLSIASLNDIFNALKNAIPELPLSFSPHTTRYTWNDRFSEIADEKIRKKEWQEKDERAARCYQMGWTEYSMMAGLYAKRHIKKKADEYSLARQEKILRADAEAADNLIEDRADD